jgi:hypothetical protein
MKGLCKSSNNETTENTRRFGGSISNFQTNSSSPDNIIDGNFDTKKSPFSQNRRSKISTKIVGKKLFCESEAEVIEDKQNNNKSNEFVVTLSNDYQDVSKNQNNIYFYHNGLQNANPNINLNINFTRDNNSTAYASNTGLHRTTPIYKSSNQQYHEYKSTPSSSNSDNENDFNKKLLEYKEQQLQYRMKQKNNYFCTTDFNKYTENKEAIVDSDSDSDIEASKEAIFENSDVKSTIKIESRNTYIKISYLIPDRLYSKFFHIKNSDENLNLKIKQSKSCPNNLSNSVGSAIDGLVKKNNFVIKNFFLNCDKNESVSEIISKIVSEINTSFISQKVNLRLIKKSESYSLRASKNSGYPDFDLPGIF